MKKTYLLYSVIAILIFQVSVASAETPSIKVSVINETKQKIVDLREKVAAEKSLLKEQVSSTTRELKDVKQELKSSAEIRIGKKIDQQKLKVAEVFEKSIKNLKDLIARIESRISKMELNNINITSSKSLLEKTKLKLSIAETELTNLENILSEDLPAISTSTPQNKIRKSMLNSIKLQSEKTKTSIKVAHKYIIDVINSLKPGLLKEKTSTSTTQTISTSTIIIN